MKKCNYCHRNDKPIIYHESLGEVITPYCTDCLFSFCQPFNTISKSLFQCRMCVQSIDLRQHPLSSVKNIQKNVYIPVIFDANAYQKQVVYLYLFCSSNCLNRATRALQMTVTDVRATKEFVSGDPTERIIPKMALLNVFLEAQRYLESGNPIPNLASLLASFFTRPADPMSAICQRCRQTMFNCACGL